MAVAKGSIFKNTTPFNQPKYRPDIDGLRALAVLSIVGFHAFPQRVAGGFIGVDIFFVISGFLISTIIFENLATNRFSFASFYRRRIRRIFPALIVVLLSCFVIGWTTLLTDEFQQMGKHMAGGAGFMANFIFWSESGYFDTKAHTKPLLHLWSLGVEEQFYIIWPFLLWMAWRYRLHILKMVTAIGAVSFAFNLIQVSGQADVAFYWPHTRFWELLMGAVLAYIKCHAIHPVTNSGDRHTHDHDKSLPNNEHTRFFENTRSFIGAVLLMTGGFLISKEMLFPGWWAVLPTAGTALLISAGPAAWINRILLSNRVLVGIGLISYPLYLWHWPLLSFARIVHSEPPTLEIRIIAVAVAVGLAWFTYLMVERPVRFGNRLKVTTGWLAILMIVVGGMGITCYGLAGLPQRSVVKLNPGKHTEWGGGIAKKNISHECGLLDASAKKLFATCVQDARQTPRFALLGDSKAAALYPGVFRTSTENGRWLFIGGNGPHSAPVPVLSNHKIYKSYQKLTRIALDAIANNDAIETVVLVTATRVLFRLKTDFSITDLPSSKHYDKALEGLIRATDKLVKAGKKVVLLVDNPTLPDPKDCLNRTTSSTILNALLVKKVNEHCEVNIDRHLKLSKKYRDLLNEVVQHNPVMIKILDPTSRLCDMKKGVCRSHLNGHRLYRYTDHISDYAAGLIGKDINAFVTGLSSEGYPPRSH